MTTRRTLLGYAAAMGLPAALVERLTAEAAPDPIRVRLNIKAFANDPAMVGALRAGVSRMKALSARSTNDPAGWIYWASIHGTTVWPPALPVYNKCDHSVPPGFGPRPYIAQHFFSWHRAFLFFFEAALKDAAKSAGASAAFELPYWNWYADGALPAIFTDGDGTSNPLWHVRVSNGLDSSALDRTALTQTSLLPLSPSTWQASFSVPFELDPHGAVHGAIGGDMGSVPTSALDPIFWLHHANIDRLWTSWLNMGQGRANPPSGSTWAQATFTFDVGGAMKKSAQQVTNSETGLGYRYDSYEIAPPAGAIAAAPARRVRLIEGRPPAVGALAGSGGGPETASRANAIALADDIVELDMKLTPAKRGQIAAMALARPPAATAVQPWLTLHDVVISPAAMKGGFSYRIVATLPQGTGGPGEVLLSTLNTFALSVAGGHASDAHSHHPAAAGPVTLSFPLEEVLRALGATEPSKLASGIRILFRPVHLSDPGAPSSPVSIGSVTVSTGPQPH